MKMIKQKRKLSQKQVLLIFCTVLIILTYIAATFPQPFLRRGTKLYGIYFAYTEDVQNQGKRRRRDTWRREAGFSPVQTYWGRINTGPMFISAGMSLQRQRKN